MKTPRKIRLDLATPPEVAIRAAMAAVASMPADVRLTNAGLRLQDALSLVSGYVDEQMGTVSFDPGLPSPRKDSPRPHETGCRCAVCNGSAA